MKLTISTLIKPYLNKINSNINYNEIINKIINILSDFNNTYINYYGLFIYKERINIMKISCNKLYIYTDKIFKKIDELYPNTFLKYYEHLDLFDTEVYYNNINKNIIDLNYNIQSSHIGNMIYTEYKFISILQNIIIKYILCDRYDNEEDFYENEWDEQDDNETYNNDDVEAYNELNLLINQLINYCGKHIKNLIIKWYLLINKKENCIKLTQILIIFIEIFTEIKKIKENNKLLVSNTNLNEERIYLILELTKEFAYIKNPFAQCLRKLATLP